MSWLHHSVGKKYLSPCFTSDAFVELKTTTTEHLLTTSENLHHIIDSGSSSLDVFLQITYFKHSQALTHILTNNMCFMSSVRMSSYRMWDLGVIRFLEVTFAKFYWNITLLHHLKVMDNKINLNPKTIRHFYVSQRNMLLNVNILLSWFMLCELHISRNQEENKKPRCNLHTYSHHMHMLLVQQNLPFRHQTTLFSRLDVK